MGRAGRLDRALRRDDRRSRRRPAVHGPALESGQLGPAEPLRAATGRSGRCQRRRGGPMTLEIVVAAALFLGVIAYAVLGGADFGSGFFDLTAGGSKRGAEVRTLIDRSIGPVWEANHVWLIYVLVTWWTAFPTSFV